MSCSGCNAGVQRFSNLTGSNIICLVSFLFFFCQKTERKCFFSFLILKISSRAFELSDESSTFSNLFNSQYASIRRALSY